MLARINNEMLEQRSHNVCFVYLVILCKICSTVTEKGHQIKYAESALAGSKSINSAVS